MFVKVLVTTSAAYRAVFEISAMDDIYFWVVERKVLEVFFLLKIISNFAFLDAIILKVWTHSLLFYNT